MQTKIRRVVNDWGTDYILSVGILGVIIYFFFNSIVAFVIASPLVIFIAKVVRKNRNSKRKGELNLQFKDLLYALSSSLGAGYSIENAIKLLEKDLLQIYSNRRVELLEYVQKMKQQLEFNMPIEKVLLDFAIQTELDDVENFVNTVTTCRKTGGNIVRVVKTASKTIGEKIDTKREIQLMVSGKRFEQNVMLAFPFVTIAFMKFSSPEFISPLYESTLGRLIMIVCLILFLVAVLIGRKILDIEV